MDRAQTFKLYSKLQNVTHIRKYGEEKSRVKKDKTKGDKTSQSSSTTYPTVGFLFIMVGNHVYLKESRKDPRDKIALVYTVRDKTFSFCSMRYCRKCM